MLFLDDAWQALTQRLAEALSILRVFLGEIPLQPAVIMAIALSMFALLRCSTLRRQNGQLRGAIDELEVKLAAESKWARNSLLALEGNFGRPAPVGEQPRSAETGIAASRREVHVEDGRFRFESSTRQIVCEMHLRDGWVIIPFGPKFSRRLSRELQIAIQAQDAAAQNNSAAEIRVGGSSAPARNGSELA